MTEGNSVRITPLPSTTKRGTALRGVPQLHLQKEADDPVFQRHNVEVQRKGPD